MYTLVVEEHSQPDYVANSFAISLNSPGYGLVEYEYYPEPPMLFDTTHGVEFGPPKSLWDAIGVVMSSNGGIR